LSEASKEKITQGIRVAKEDFLGLFKNRNFARLFWGQLISSAGDWIATLALMTFVWQLTRSSLAVGGMLAFRIVPAMFSGPVAAFISDKIDRKKLLISCDISRGVIILGAPLMTKLWGLYVLLFFLEGISIIWLAARDASIPNIVKSEELTAANSLSMATTYGIIPFAAIAYSLLMIPSPITRHFAHGGFLAKHPTILAFFADSATFFISASFFSRMSLKSPKAKETTISAEGFIESVTFTFKNPFARSLLAGAAMGCVGGGSLYAVGIGYVKEVLGAGDVAFGFLMALFGAGMLAGIIALEILVKTEEKPWMLRISLLTTGGILIGMAIVKFLPLAYLLAGFFGASFGILFVVAVTLVQERFADEDRGKAFAAFHAISRIFLVLGAGLAGGIAGLVGVRKLRVLGITYHIHGVALSLFIAGVLIASVSIIPLGEKKEHIKEYFIREAKESPENPANP